MGTGSCEHKRRKYDCLICGGFKLRAREIIRHGAKWAKKRNFVAAKTTVTELTNLMNESKLCFLCGGQLDWTQVSAFVTPHLHHDHETGQVFGFVHPICNRVEGFIFIAKKDSNVNCSQLLLSILRRKVQS